MKVRLGFVGLGLLTGVAIAACGGDDEATGAGGSGGASTATTTSGGGDMSTTTNTTSTGSSMSDVVCDLDNKCKSDEHCACSDCWIKESCNTNACNADGTCDADESCACADCAADEACTDYCVNCQTFATYFAGRDALCANSATLYNDFETCACSNASPCLGDCQVTLCQGLSPSLDCQACIEDNCATQRDACFADTADVVKCNPVTQDGCNPNQGNERCDYITVPESDILSFAPRTVVGFICKLETNNADQCTACNYNFGSQTKCEKGNTCVDPGGNLVPEGTCGRYCCDDTDCGTGGVGSCQKGAFNPVAPGLGTCTTGVQPTDPGCDAPGLGMSTSMGSCVTPN